MGKLWYPTAAMQRLNVPVLVRWGWVRPFVAMLVADKPRSWVAVTRNAKGETEHVALPPTRVKGGFLPARTTGEPTPLTGKQRDVWGSEPRHWQPIGVWPEPLPEPLTLGMVADEERLGSIGRVAFDATEAAAEMEADRETARARHGNAKRDGNPEDQIITMPWWRDASRIRYRDPGEVRVETIEERNPSTGRLERHQRDMAEGRLMRALAWCGYGQDLSLREVSVASLYREAVSKVAECNDDEDKLRLIMRGLRFDPLPADRRDFLVAMGWFCRVSDSHTTTKIWKLSKRQRVLVERAKAVPKTWSEIGNIVGVSNTRAIQLFEAGLADVRAEANRPVTIDGVILRLRAQNRAYHRNENGRNEQAGGVL